MSIGCCHSCRPRRWTPYLLTGWIGTLSLPQLAYAQDSGIGLPAAPLIYLTWTLAIGLSLLLALALLRRLRRGSEDRLFERRNVRLIGLALVGLFLALALTLANQGLGEIDQRLRQDLVKTLQSVNRSAAQTLRIWVESHLRETELIAADQALIPLVRQLQQAADAPERLHTSPAHEQVRALIAAKRDLADTSDAFVLGLDGRVLTAFQSQHMGRLHPLAKCDPFDFARILASSEPLFLPPSAPNQEQTAGSCQLDALFLLAAIRDERGGMLAVLGLELRPVEALTQMTKVGQIGATGETYVFDAEGRLMTRSRFAEQPIAGARPDIGMRIADPGGDLTAGYEPTQPPSDWPLSRMAQAALNGENGADTEGYRDYRGVPVLGVWSWSDPLGVGIATEIDQAEALAPYRALRNPVLGALFGVVLLALGLMATLAWLGERARRRLDELVEVRTRDLRTYVQAVEQNPLCIIVTDPNGAIEHTNPTFTAITGYSAEEALGENPRLLKSDSTPPETYEQLWATILSGQIWHGELCNRKKNGDTYWVSLSIAPVLDESGEVTHFIGITQDLTATKQTALALHEAETARNLALEAAQVGLWSGDLQTDEWSWDARVARLLGLPEDLPPALEHWIDALHPDDRDWVMADFDAAVRGEAALEFEFRVCWPDGSEHFIAARGKTRLDEHSHPLRIDGVAFDRTALRRAEAEIEAVHERNALILDSAGEGIIGIDREGRITFCNRAASALLGYAADRLVGQPLHTTLHHQHADGSRFAEPDCPMNHTLRDGQRRQVDEDVLWRQDGSTLLVEYVMVPMRKGGEQIGAVLVFKDIAERVEAQQTLIAERQQLQGILDSSPLSAAISVDSSATRCAWAKC